MDLSLPHLSHLSLSLWRVRARETGWFTGSRVHGLHWLGWLADHRATPPRHKTTWWMRSYQTKSQGWQQKLGMGREDAPTGPLDRRRSI